MGKHLLKCVAGINAEDEQSDAGMDDEDDPIQRAITPPAGDDSISFTGQFPAQNDSQVQNLPSLPSTPGTLRQQSPSPELEVDAEPVALPSSLPGELLSIGVLGMLGFGVQKRLGAISCIECEQLYPSGHVVGHAKKEHYVNHTLPAHFGTLASVEAEVARIAAAENIGEGFPDIPTSIVEEYKGSFCTGLSTVSNWRLHLHCWHKEHTRPACVTQS